MHDHYRDVAPERSHVRPGRLYRTGWTLITGCPGPTHPTGVTAIDVRSVEEGDALPVATGGPVRRIPIDVPGAMAILGRRPTNTEYGALNVATLMVCGAEIAAVAVAVAEALPGPVAIGCSLGKDRTGLIVGVLTCLLGVSDDDAVDEDTRARAALLDCPPAVDRYAAARAATSDELARRCLLDGAALRAALDDIRARHRTVANYLLAHGADQASLDRLRAGLLR